MFSLVIAVLRKIKFITTIQSNNRGSGSDNTYTTRSFIKSANVPGSMNVSLGAFSMELNKAKLISVLELDF